MAHKPPARRFRDHRGHPFDRGCCDLYPHGDVMAYAEETPRMAGPINEHASALAQEWRRLTRAATFVALLTAPAFFLILFDTNHLGVVASLIITVLAVI